jgi:transcriptional regulator with GAF, ATPase, and Fis domain
MLGANRSPEAILSDRWPNRSDRTRAGGPRYVAASRLVPIVRATMPMPPSVGQVVASSHSRCLVQPKLASLSGPLRKAEFAVGSTLTIGSDLSNTICLVSPHVSARHCVLSQQDGRCVLTDLESHSGTFVNGLPVKRRELSSGDHIAVGESVFLYLAEGVASSRSSSVEIETGAAVESSVRQLRPEDLVYLHPQSLAALPQSERLSRNLSTLLRISTAIGSFHDVDALQWQLLGMIFDVIPAERGAILLVDSESGEIASHVAWDRVAGPDKPVSVSETIVRRVLEEHVSLLDNTPGSSSRTASAAPSGSKHGHSILCVPLQSGVRTLGLLYLDSWDPATNFSEDDLQLLSAIAGLAAVAIENARQFELLGIENQQLRAEVSLEHDMVGRSTRMREVYQFIERVAPSEATVLIYGESGTGKELAARAVHKNSPRRSKPFVALNCAALTETLLESELFGHEKGSFTGAFAQKKGLLEVAEDGSVFLDEVGELSPVMQAKLLRVLQEREFVRVGGTRTIGLNARFLAATNRDLPKAVREGQFRTDLYHRLNVISLTLPPLRERAEDIAALAEHFAARYAKQCKRVVKGISDEGRQCLLQYDWPGNVRELENAMERAVVVGTSEWILPEDLPEALLDTSSGTESGSAKYHDAVRNLKKNLILNALEQSDGSITEAAKVLGVHANYLHRLISNLELRPTLKKHTKA